MRALNRHALAGTRIQPWSDLTRAKCSTLVGCRDGLVCDQITHRFAMAAVRRSKIARMVGSERISVRSMRPSPKLIGTALRHHGASAARTARGAAVSGCSTGRCSSRLDLRSNPITWAFTIIGDRANRRDDRPDLLRVLFSSASHDDAGSRCSWCGQRQPLGRGIILRPVSRVPA
jgi:hypothetical protein